MKIKIGQKLKTKREEMNLSQSEFSELLNMSTSAYNRLERGETSANFEQLANISDILKIPIQEFLPEFSNLYSQNHQSQGGIVMGDFVYNNYVSSSDNEKKLETENTILKKELSELNERLKLLEEMILKFQK